MTADYVIELTPEEEVMRELRQRIDETMLKRVPLREELVDLANRRADVMSDAEGFRAQRMWREAREAEQQGFDILAETTRVQAELSKLNDLNKRYGARVHELQSSRQTPDGLRQRLAGLYEVANAAFDALYADGDDEELMDRLEDAVTDFRKIDPIWRGSFPTKDTPKKENTK